MRRQLLLFRIEILKIRTFPRCRSIEFDPRSPRPDDQTRKQFRELQMSYTLLMYGTLDTLLNKTQITPTTDCTQT